MPEPSTQSTTKPFAEAYPDEYANLIVATEALRGLLELLKTSQADDALMESVRKSILEANYAVGPIINNPPPENVSSTIDI